jgi:hypothetical protein
MATAQETKGKTRSQARVKSRAPQRETPTGRGAESAQGATIPIPVPEIHTKRVSVPANIGQAGRTVTGQLRPSGRLVFYGGLAAVAAFGIIDWPVAAAIGIGTVIARRSR